MIVIYVLLQYLGTHKLEQSMTYMGREGWKWKDGK